jgi:hypothetical protein
MIFRLGNGAIPLSNMRPLTIREWAEQLPFLLVDFAMAGLLGAAFNSLRMWLWKVNITISSADNHWPWNAWFLVLC